MAFNGRAISPARVLTAYEWSGDCGLEGPQEEGQWVL